MARQARPGRRGYPSPGKLAYGRPQDPQAIAVRPLQLVYLVGEARQVGRSTVRVDFGPAGVADGFQLG